MTSSERPAKLGKEELERRRRAAQLIGDLLPDTTTDETAEGWNENDASSRDADFLRDVPPHHG
jgi:hypothetical protein